MNEEVLSLERELDVLVAKIGRMGSSDPLSRRNGAEATYGQVYQRLVRLGARPQIRMKYRAFTR
jgi:hypothetical protein